MFVDCIIFKNINSKFLNSLNNYKDLSNFNNSKNIINKLYKYNGNLFLNNITIIIRKGSLTKMPQYKISWAIIIIKTGSK